MENITLSVKNFLERIWFSMINDLSTSSLPLLLEEEVKGKIKFHCPHHVLSSHIIQAFFSHVKLFLSFLCVFFKSRFIYAYLTYSKLNTFKLNNLKGFHTCIYSWNYHHNQSRWWTYPSPLFLLPPCNPFLQPSLLPRLTPANHWFMFCY